MRGAFAAARAAMAALAGRGLRDLWGRVDEGGGLVQRRLDETGQRGRYARGNMMHIVRNASGTICCWKQTSQKKTAKRYTVTLPLVAHWRGNRFESKQESLGSFEGGDIPLELALGRPHFAFASKGAQKESLEDGGCRHVSRLSKRLGAICHSRAPEKPLASFAGNAGVTQPAVCRACTLSFT